MVIPQEKEVGSSLSEESSLSDSLLQQTSSPAMISSTSVAMPLSSQDMNTRPLRSASAPVTGSCRIPNTCSIQDQLMYEKRGTKKLKSSLVEEALNIMKQVATQPISIPQGDSAEYFGGYIAAKLREMDPVKRKACEEKIMRALLD